MREKCRAGVLEAPRTFVVREFETPKAGEEDILLEVEMCTICGSDLPVYKGMSPEGKFPMILGHELVGRIADMGRKAKDQYPLKAGDRVVYGGWSGCGTCRLCREGNSRLCQAKKYPARSCTEYPHLFGGMSEYMYILGGRDLHPLAEEVPAEAGCLGNNVGNGVYYTQFRGGVKKGNAVVISGVGGQGLGCVIGAKDAGAFPIIVTGLGWDGARFDFAKKLGADYAIDVEKEDPVEKVKTYTHGELADVVVETSGHPQALKMAMSYVRPTGTVSMVGLNWPNLPLDGGLVNQIVFKELNVVGALGPRRSAMERAIQIINSGKFPIEEFITHRFTLSQLDEAFRTFDEKKEECIKVGIAPREKRVKGADSGRRGRRAKNG
jgi:alcohol dehydrogenase